jgi:hypothetical protein
MAVRLSALRAGRLPFNPRKIPGTYFCWRLSWPQGHSVAGRIRSIEKSNDPIGNRTSDLPACSIVLWKGCGKKLSWPNLRHYLGISLEKLRKTTKKHSQCGQYPGQDLNQEPLDNKSRVLLSQPASLMSSILHSKSFNKFKSSLLTPHIHIARVWSVWWQHPTICV